MLAHSTQEYKISCMSQLESEYTEEPYVAVDRDLVGLYINQAAQTELLDAEKEVELSQRMEAGLYAGHLLMTKKGTLTETEQAELEWIAEDGKEAKTHFINANLRLVIWQAKKMKRQEEHMTELIQEGNLGLIRAVEKFDYTKGFKFATYAPWWIKQSIARGTANLTRTVYLPVHTVEEIKAIGTAERILENQGLDTSPEMLAKETGFEVDKVTKLLDWRQNSISLDAPIGEDGDTTIGDVLETGNTLGSPEESAISSEMADEVRTLVSKLEQPRYAKIIEMRYGLTDGRSYTFAEIGRVIGVSAERTRQLEREALQKLRNLATK